MSSKPKCPHCNITLQLNKSDGIFKYYCFKCYGILSHIQSIKKSMSVDARKKFNAEVLNSSQSKISCTYCNEKLKLIQLPNIEVQIDYCTHCSTAWFDKSELPTAEQTHSPVSKTSDSKSRWYLYGKALIEIKYQTPQYEVNYAQFSENKFKYVIAALGFPTELEKDDFLLLPLFTWSLMIAIFIISAIGFKNINWFVDNLSFSTEATGISYLYRMISSFFVHANYIHLLGNLYFLWVFGDDIEDYLGEHKYILLLLSSAILGCLVFNLFHNQGPPLIGASGGISGLIGFYIMKFPKKRFLVRGRYGVLNVSSIAFGAFFIFTQLIYAFIFETSGHSNVAFSGHVGGFLAGVMFYYYTLYQEQT
ncbi:MAG: rhomboid family intramembrane serine protease [Pseudobdellovibrio sp.]